MVYRKYYEGQQKKLERQYEEPLMKKRWCWRIESMVVLSEGNCMQVDSEGLMVPSSCPYKFAVGCLIVKRGNTEGN